MNRAIALLSYGGSRVGEVAEEVGFSDIYYFSRVFKALTGSPPEQFTR